MKLISVLMTLSSSIDALEMKVNEDGENFFKKISGK